MTLGLQVHNMCSHLFIGTDHFHTFPTSHDLEMTKFMFVLFHIYEGRNPVLNMCWGRKSVRPPFLVVVCFEPNTHHKVMHVLTTSKPVYVWRLLQLRFDGRVKFVCMSWRWKLSAKSLLQLSIRISHDHIEQQLLSIKTGGRAGEGRSMPTGWCLWSWENNKTSYFLFIATNNKKRVGKS